MQSGYKRLEIVAILLFPLTSSAIEAFVLVSRALPREGPPQAGVDPAARERLLEVGVTAIWQSSASLRSRRKLGRCVTGSASEVRA